MTARVEVKQADIARAIRAAKSQGLTVAGIEVTPRRVSIVLAAQPESPQGPQPKEWPKE